MTEHRPAQRKRAPTPSLHDASEVVARAVGVVAVAGTGLIHLLDAIDTFHENPMSSGCTWP